MNYVIRQGKRIEVVPIETGAGPKRHRADPFVKLPLPLAATIAKATRTLRAMVWILVLYEAWKARGKPFRLSNVKLARYGVNRERKRQALAKMEAAGLITVHQQGKQSTIVTWNGCHGGVTASQSSCHAGVTAPVTRA
jgi:hypothetical protein